MTDQLVQAYVAYQSWRATLWNRIVKDESGEGVISVAIAVLIMAFLGAGMWLAFNQLFNNASTKTTNQVNQIGS